MKVISALLLGATLAACSGSNDPGAGDAGTGGDGAPNATGCDPGCLVTSSKPRELLASLPPEVAELVAGNTSFATRLYRTLRAERPQANLFYSPHSISVALAMAYAGARAETATQMTTALDLRLGQQSHRAFNGLDQELARRASQAPASDAGDPFQLSVANALWGRTGEAFLPEFLDRLSVNYGAGLRVLDFRNQTEPARLTINQWVADKTAGKIKDLLPMGTIKPSTVLVLTNAIYFKASWLHRFQEAGTTPRPFTRLDGTSVDVPTMQLTEGLRYAETPELQAVDLPYLGNQVSMLVVAPKPGKLAAFEEGLTPAALAALDGALEGKHLRLALPKFKLEAQLGLKDTLATLGMAVAFSDAADFSGINGTGGLTISDVVHKAFVAVDEKGTEAAAATGVVFGPTSAPPPPQEVNIDRPFPS